MGKTNNNNKGSGLGKNVNDMTPDEIKQAIAQGKIQKKKIPDDVQQFLDYAANNQISNLKDILSDQSKSVKLINEVDANRRSALHFACHSGNLETFDLLIKAKADINLPDFGNYTPLMIAIKMGNSKIAQRLIESGADVNAKNQEGFSALTLAVLSSEVDIVKLLLEKNAEISTVEESESGSILHAAYHIKGKDLSVIETLVKKYPTLLKTRDGNDMEPLHIACASGNTDYAKVLIKLGADVNAVAIGGCTPLHICVDSDNQEVITDLLAHGALLKLDEQGETPLLMAKNGKKKTLESMLENIKLDPTPYKPIKSNKKSKSSSKPKISADDLKENGNRAFRKGEYDVALNWYQLAADVDDVSREVDGSLRSKEPIAYILHSNKSACHYFLKNYTEALNEAEKTIELSPQWPKGYLRKSQALEALGRKEEAKEATDKMNQLNESQQTK